MISPCPCGSQLSYKECCSPIIDGLKDAKTAEKLMRSRYTAFTIANVDYLMNSHHTQSRNIKEKKEIKRWAKSVKWIGLTILKKEKGLENDNTGLVEFKAVFVENGQINSIHESSLFEKEHGKWVYIKGNQFS